MGTSSSRPRVPEIAPIQVPQGYNSDELTVDCETIDVSAARNTEDSEPHANAIVVAHLRKLKDDGKVIHRLILQGMYAPPQDNYLATIAEVVPELRYLSVSCRYFKEWEVWEQVGTAWPNLEGFETRDEQVTIWTGDILRLTTACQNLTSLVLMGDVEGDGQSTMADILTQVGPRMKRFDLGGAVMPWDGLPSGTNARLEAMVEALPSLEEISFYDLEVKSGLAPVWEVMPKLKREFLDFPLEGRQSDYYDSEEKAAELHRRIMLDRCEKLLKVHGKIPGAQLQVREETKTRELDGESINASQLFIGIPISASVNLLLVGELGMASDEFQGVLHVIRKN